MSSALKPVITPAGPQNASVGSQLNKPIHSQGTSNSYGQQPSHMPQNLVTTHNQSHTNVHNATHHASASVHNAAHSANHYSLNVPATPQHYSSGNQSSYSSSSNHSVANAAQPLPASTYNTPSKNPILTASYQPNLGQPPNVPVTQSLPATQTPHQSSPTEDDKPQSNGTPEPVSTNEVQQNHVSSQREKSPQQHPSPDKLKPDQVAPAPSVDHKQPETKEEIKEQTPVITSQVADVSENKSDAPTAASADSSTEIGPEGSSEEKPEDKEVQSAEEQATTTTPTPSTPIKKEQVLNHSPTDPNSQKTAFLQASSPILVSTPDSLHIFQYATTGNPNKPPPNF